MVAEPLLKLFDEQMRPHGVVPGGGWTMVFRAPDDGDVERLLSELRAHEGYREWKYYEHDGPELRERLLAAGLEPEDEETVLVAESASIPPPPADVELRKDRDAFTALVHAIFGDRGHGFPEHAIPVVAFVEGKPVSGGRVDLEPGVDFAGMFGGVTLPEFRGRGLYRATVARRAELAREAGFPYLYVDALATSRPILERVGFAKLTTTTPFEVR